MVSPLVPLLVIFAEPDFPMVDVSALPTVDGAIVARSVVELEEALQPGRVLVWRHGSAFPSDAWPCLLRFLEDGGSILYLGGEPFTRPVEGPRGRRAVQPRTLACLKELRLNQCYRLDVGQATLRYRSSRGKAPPSRKVSGEAKVSILEPRLTDNRQSEEEEGSPGPREAIVRPLAHLHLTGADERFPAAAGCLAIDRLSGRFAGGRWVFWLLSDPPTQHELDFMLAQALRPPIELRVDPRLGCFHQGERPSVLVRLHQPRAEPDERRLVDLEVLGPDGVVQSIDAIPQPGGPRSSVEVPLEVGAQAGLYRVSARTADVEPAETGFWVFDARLFSSGDDLTFDHYTLRRNGVPEPVVGTTTMSATVHRDFLFEPNAAVWDDTFAELATLKVNLVRTGVWYGWRKISPTPQVVDEAWLRALEAYYLTARKHGIPIIFTFFAFLPESFGGQNPYLDPRAVAGQRAYVAAVASRFADAKEILWDLINEPSFCSAEHLWNCRPNGDAYDEQAFLDWLRRRYSQNREDPADTSWPAVVRARWRLPPHGPIGLPSDEDFNNRHVFEGNRPYGAAEYVHFAQDAFTDWMGQMSAAIRQAGSAAPITVGQDEGGLLQRPSPLFHHRAVDFTSMHTWWFDDALLWDGLMAKAAGKPLLISETGVMQGELLSGEATRDPDDTARLLSRKIGYAFASGAFGLVQWCYEVNPYMPSDNEVAIGLKRVDGSYKPELYEFRKFAAFLNRNRVRFDSPAEPQAVIVVPSGEQFSPRDFATGATRRAVEVLYHQLGVPARLVPEYRAAEDLGQPKVIILPACRGICESAWQAIVELCRNGAVLLCSGWFETDDAGLPAERLGLKRRTIYAVEPCEPTPS
ncbi:MAG: hypothetical protein ACYSVY_16565, partial [Planctomycetota bacterium]